MAEALHFAKMKREEEIFQEVLESAGEFFISGIRFLKAILEMASIILKRSGKGRLSGLMGNSLLKFSEELNEILKESEIIGAKKEPGKKKGFKKIKL